MGPWHAGLRCPEALVLVAHGEGQVVEPGGDWNTVRTGRCTTLLQAPQYSAAIRDAVDFPGPRWVLGEADSPADEWVSLLDSPETVYPISEATSASDNLHTLETWPEASGLRAIDFFCGANPADPTGEEAVWRLVSFVQALVSYRIEYASHPCRLTVGTRGAVCEVDDPRGSGMWAAVRSMAAEVGEEAGIDFRLIDLGDSDDLKTLAWLARSDFRERELAIRQGRLWVPRVVSLRERSSYLAAGVETAYRLTLENPGQISGLQMKTHQLPPLGPSGVEIDVAAAALNFRDVMVTLGLLPALAYERSAMGREVGMEGSGIVRRVGPRVRNCHVGDEVAFIQGGCVANRVVLDEHHVFAKPARLGMEETASTLSAYVTAYYSLIHLARLRRGQRVLIHSAMGGVGQAAIALARYVGAEIFATRRQRGKARAIAGSGCARGL